jgi:curved DNA-binding protein CbpA
VVNVTTDPHIISFYSLLKIDPAAGHESIESSFSDFKTGIAKYGPGLELKDEDLEKQFPEIWKAYSVLLDPDKRKEYDLAWQTPPFIKTEIKNAAIELEEEIPETPRARFIRICTYFGAGIFLAGVLYLLSHFFAL